MKISRIAVGLLLPAGLALAQKEPEKATPSPTAQSQAGTESQKSASSKSADQSGTAEVKTKTYKGELVDASCAGGGGPATTSSAASSGQSAADRSSASAGKSAGKSGEANRSGDNGQSCGATSSTSEFALRTKTGTAYRFDAVGNERAKEAIAARKKWSDAIAAGKPVQVEVSATEANDRLTVMSIH